MPGKLYHLRISFQNLAPPPASPGVTVPNGIVCGHVVDQKHRFIGGIFDRFVDQLSELFFSDALPNGDKVVTVQFGDRFRSVKNIQMFSHVRKYFVNTIFPVAPENIMIGVSKKLHRKFVLPVCRFDRIPVMLVRFFVVMVSDIAAVDDHIDIERTEKFIRFPHQKRRLRRLFDVRI